MNYLMTKRLGLAAAFLLGACAMQPVIADSQATSGTYLLDQADGKKQLLTLTNDGQAFSQNSGQFDPPTVFGNQQGIWKKVKSNIVVKTLDFNLDSTNNNKTNGYGRSTFTMKFDKSGKLSGDVTVEIFAVDADPTSATAVPTSTFGPTAFTGSRLTIK